MTDNFEALAQKMPVFGELQNLMDLSVVSTLIVQQQLEGQAGVDLSVLRDPEALSPEVLDAPGSIAPECSFIKGRAGWIVTASGGVSVSPFEIVHNQIVDSSLTDKVAVNPASGWYWDKQ